MEKPKLFGIVYRLLMLLLYKKLELKYTCVFCGKKWRTTEVKNGPKQYGPGLPTWQCPGCGMTQARGSIKKPVVKKTTVVLALSILSSLVTSLGAGFNINWLWLIGFLGMLVFFPWTLISLFSPGKPVNGRICSKCGKKHPAVAIGYHYENCPDIPTWKCTGCGGTNILLRH
jgi:ribosomal protein L37AE/L43A